MEKQPVRSSSRFSKRITSSNANNIVIVLDLFTKNSKYQAYEEDYNVGFQVALEDVKVTIGLFSLSIAPFPNVNDLMTEATKQAEIAKVQTEYQKISLEFYTAEGNGPWEYQSSVTLQNQNGQENQQPVLVPFLSTNETMLVDGDFKLGCRIAPIWNQPLKSQDYLVIAGTYKQVVGFTEKKNDSIKNLLARIETLELALGGRLTELAPNTLLGRNAGTGSVETIPQSIFAKPEDINIAISKLVADAPGTLNTLDELAAALADDANFASWVTTQLAQKASIGALAGYLPKGGYSGNNPDNFLTGIQGADYNLGEGLAGWHFLTVLRDGNSVYGIQLALSDTLSPKRIKFRNKLNGTWQTWNTVTLS